MKSIRTILAGAGRSDITPPIGTPHLNWGAASHEVAAGVDMEIYSTALYLADGKSDLVIVNMDVATLPEELALELRHHISEQTGIDFDRVYLTWTHTHSAVLLHDTPWMRSGRELWLEYRRTFVARAAEAAVEAKKNVRSARIGWGKGKSDLGINRRQHLKNGRIITGNNPDGPVDREVIVLRIDDGSAPIAVLVNFATHPTIAGHENDKITPDYPGAMKRVVERNLGGLCLFFQGATGDIGPVEGFTGDLAVYRNAGARLGYEVCRVAEGIRTAGGSLDYEGVVESGAPLGIHRWHPGPVEAITIQTGKAVAALIPHPTEPLEKLKAEYDAIEARLHRAQQDASASEIRELHGQAKRAALQFQRALRLKETGAVDIPIHAIGLGEMALVFTPLEPFCEIGMNIKQRSPFAATLFGGYAMGGYFICYLPTDKALDEGGYEVGISLFGKGSAKRLEDEAVHLLEKLGAGASSQEHLR